MYKNATLMLSILFLFHGCSMVKGLFGKKSIGDPNNPDFLNRVQELKSAYREGDIQALDELIEVYENPDLHVKLRVAAGKTLAQTEHPRALHSISEMVATTTALDYALLNESIKMLGMFKENPKAADALVRSMHKMEDKTNEIHISLIKNLRRVRTKDQILALLDLYEVAKSNMSRTERLLTESMGAIGNAQVIPILTQVARDPKINIGIRNQAVEIFHFELDARDYNEFKLNLDKLENFIDSTDWESKAKDLLSKKDEWLHLNEYDQAVYKAKFYDFDKIGIKYFEEDYLNKPYLFSYLKVID